MQVQKGRYQTRLSRIADVTHSEMALVDTPTGQVEQRRWHGVLLNSDAKTIDTPMQWDDRGQRVNPRGVVTPEDLTVLILAAPADPAPEKVATPEPAKPAAEDPRVKEHLPQLRSVLVGTLAKVTAEKGLIDFPEDSKDMLPVSDSGFEHWAELIAETVLLWIEKFPAKVEAPKADAPKK